MFNKIEEVSLETARSIENVEQPLHDGKKTRKVPSIMDLIVFLCEKLRGIPKSKGIHT